MEFDLYVIRSWDGNNSQWGGTGTPKTGDRWSFGVDGVTQLDTTFRNWQIAQSGVPDQSQEYAPAGTPPTAYAPGGVPLFDARTGAAEFATLGYTYTGGAGIPYQMDAVYRLSFTVAHSDPSAVLGFAASGLQPLADESWGIDNVRVTASDARVMGRAWLDGNGDGRQDAGERGLGGVTVRLYDAADMLVATGVTDRAGDYGFAGLPADGLYRVGFVAPNGYSFTTRNAAPDGVDSDAAADGRTGLYAIPTGGDLTTVAAGLTGQGPIAYLPRVYVVAEDRVYDGMDLPASGYDPDGDYLSVVIVQGPTHGSLTARGSGVYDYTGSSGYRGLDSFRYVLTDGVNYSDEVQVDLLTYDGELDPGEFGDFPALGDALYVGNGNKPDFAQIAQGGLNDCWFVAAAASLLLKRPNAIPGLLTDNGGGSYTVDFPDYDPVTINFTNDPNAWSSSNGDWLRALEKGFGQARWNSQTFTIFSPRDYINTSNPPSRGIAALTGSDDDTDNLSTTREAELRADLTAAFANNKVVTALSGVTSYEARATIDGIERRHVYAVVGWNPAVGEIELFNPWGYNRPYRTPTDPAYFRGKVTATTPNTTGRFWMSVDEFYKTFHSICYEE